MSIIDDIGNYDIDENSQPRDTSSPVQIQFQMSNPPFPNVGNSLRQDIEQMRRYPQETLAFDNAIPNSSTKSKPSPLDIFIKSIIDEAVNKVSSSGNVSSKKNQLLPQVIRSSQSTDDGKGYTLLQTDLSIYKLLNFVVGSKSKMVELFNKILCILKENKDFLIRADTKNYVLKIVTIIYDDNTVDLSRGDYIFYDVMDIIVKIIAKYYTYLLDNNDIDHIMIDGRVNTTGKMKPALNNINEFYRGWESLMKQTGYSKSGKYFFFGDRVLYKFPKYDIQTQIRVRNIISYMDTFWMDICPISEYNNKISYFVEDTQTSDIDRFKRLVELCRKTTGRKLFPIIIYETYVIEFSRKKKKFYLSSIKLEDLDYVVNECVACGDIFMELRENSCENCCKKHIPMCKACKVQHIKAKIEDNVDNGSTPLDIKCLCGDFSFINTFGAQNSSQYCHIHKSIGIGPLKDQILSLLRVWRYNMLQNWMNSKVISDKDKERFINEQKELLETLKADDPTIIARNCPGCGTCIVKSNGCNAVVCMNKSAGCTSRFCIACGKVFTNMARTEICECSGETQAITTHWFEPQHLREQMTGRVTNNKGYIKSNLAKLV